MSNEQQAHDFALMLTGFYLANPQKAKGQILELFSSEMPSEEELFYSPFCLYKSIYQKALSYFSQG